MPIQNNSANKFIFSLDFEECARPTVPMKTPVPRASVIASEAIDLLVLDRPPSRLLSSADITYVLDKLWLKWNVMPAMMAANEPTYILIPSFVNKDNNGSCLEFFPSANLAFDSGNVVSKSAITHTFIIILSREAIKPLIENVYLAWYAHWILLQKELIVWRSNTQKVRGSKARLTSIESVAMNLRIACTLTAITTEQRDVAYLFCLSFWSSFNCKLSF